nr:hypothetical protein [Tanacetum cinerariifolium]
DPEFPARVYKVEKAMYGLHQAPRAWYGTLSNYLLTNGFQMGTIDQNLFIRRQRGDFILVQVYMDDIIFGSSNLQLFIQKEDGIFLSQDKYGKEGTGKDVDLYLYRSMIGSLMYLTASRPDIMFAICACARHKVTLKECHLHAVKRIFRYLKGHPKLGLWYPKQSPFDLIAYSDSDYGGATQDHKSTTGGCQFLGRRLISWQCKKQTIMATSTTEASCCRQVLWIQNQLLDYGLSMPCEALSREISSSILRFEHNVDFHPMVDFVEAFPLRRNLKLQDEEGIISLPDTELFENLTLMGYNISPNQKFTFQKGRIVPLFDTILVPHGEGSGTPTEPHHTPSPEAQHTSHTTHSSLTIPSVITALIPPVTSSDTPPIRQYTRRTKIAQSSVLPPVANEPASPLRDVSQGEACPTDFGFIADQDMANIAKTSTLPYDSAPRVTSPAADEGSMQQTNNELADLCTSLQRQHSEMIAKFEAHELEINRLKARVKLLEDREGVAAARSGDDAPIKGRNLDEGDAVTERVSDDTEEMANVLTSMDAATVLAAGVADVSTGSGPIPTASPPADEVPTSSDVVPTASLVFATATVVTPYRRRKGKEVMVEYETPKKQKVQEKIDAQSMIDGLDRSNETVAKYLQEYQQFASELPLERRIEQISDLVRYQDNYAKVHKFQTQQGKPWSKKQKRDYYMDVIRSNLGWKVKDFRGMSFDEIKAKFTTVWKQLEDFIPIGSKEEAERLKRKEKVKEMMQLVPIEEVYVEALKVKHPIIDWKVHTEGQRSYWKIIRLGGSSASYQFFVDLLKHMDREDLNQLWALVKESLSNRQPTSNKEMELWVELKKLYEPDNEDQLWTHTQNLMHAPVEWKLYDMCGVHQLTSKDKEICMLVEKDYPLRKGLALVMISYKLQVENYSRMANDLILKIFKIGRIVGNKMLKAFLLPLIEFPLAEEVHTASEESSHCQKKRDATAKRIALLVTPTKPRRMTKPYSSHRFIANCLNAGNFKMEVKVPKNPRTWGADEELSDREPIYTEYIPLKDEHILSGEEQPLPPVVSPTAESPGYVAESDPKEDLEEYEDDETEDGPIDYPMDGGDDGDDDDSDSSRDDADADDEDEEEEEEEEHLAPADFTIDIPTDDLVAPPEGIEPVEFERLLAMPTPSPSPLTLLSPPSAEERLARCTAPAALPSPPIPPPLHMSPPIDCRDDVPETEMPPRKRLCLSTLGSGYEVGESSTARLTGCQMIDYGFVSILDAEARRRGLGEVGYGIKDTWIDPTETVPEIAPMTVGEVNTRVIEFAELHEYDRHDLYALLEDAQDSYDRSSPYAKLHQRRWKPQFARGQPKERANCAFLFLRPDAYSMTWEVFKKKMTNKYCPQGEIKKLEIELWNLKVKENNVSAYTKRFKELNLICTKFVADETEKIDKYVSRLLDNIYGSVKASNPKTLDETIELANDLMDQKLCTKQTLPTWLPASAAPNKHPLRGCQPRQHQTNTPYVAANLGSTKQTPPMLLPASAAQTNTLL